MQQEANLVVDNLKIAGQLFWPDEGSAPFPAVILCHGVPSGIVDPADGGYPQLAQTMTQSGLAAFTFRFRGSGESEGNFDILGWQRDLQGVIEYIQIAPKVRKDQVALVGFSAGGALALCQTARDQRIKAVAACAAPVDFNAIFEAEKPQLSVTYFRKIGIIRDENFPPSLPEWLAHFKQINALDCVNRIAPRPLLLLQSEEDKVVPIDNALRLFEKAGEPKQLRLFPGDVHQLRKHPAAVDTLIDWLRQIFKG
jgi:uncharacterized protein